MVLDFGLTDNSAMLARDILKRGTSNLEYVLQKVCGGNDFVYVACPDFSISLRQRRLILGLPIGGYVRWNSDYRFFPLELDVNSCGVHVLELGTEFDEDLFQHQLFSLKDRLDKEELVLGGAKLKWNFSRRNHFINVYRSDEGVYYMVAHSSGETTLFDWENLHRLFDVKHIELDGHPMPYILGDDVDQYYSIAKVENEFFFKRHSFLFDILLGEGNYKTVYADQHFGMINQGEILMGCSKLLPNTVFPLLTRPFEDLVVAKILSPPQSIIEATNGYALVPHGLGMTVPTEVIDITPSRHGEGYVNVTFENGSKMVTDTLEYVGIGYRAPEVVSEMSRKVGFEVIKTLKGVLFTKL